MPDLKELLKVRQGDVLMQERDYAYSVFDAYIMSRRSGKDRDKTPQLTYKPFSTSRFAYQTPPNHKLAINLSRRVHSYFTSTFAKVPALYKQPNDTDAPAQKVADNMTFWMDGLFTKSRVKAGQPRTASWLSNRGDAVLGVEWDSKAGDIFIRAFDPAWCYPTLDPFDVGGVSDMLITFSMNRELAQSMYKVQLPRNTEKKLAQVFLYWDHKERVVQVDGTKSTTYSFKHELERCPFRWIFGNNDAMYAQSDIRDIPVLQDFYNENLVLAMDTIRKQVDAAWIVFGHNKDLTPKPGQAVGIPRETAKLQRFEAGGDPQTIMSVMGMLEAGIESSTGMSPASSRGVVSGSTLTGAAIRNQVQAMEARNEARKYAFEDAYEQIGTLSLQVLERCMGKDGVTVRRGVNSFQLKPADVDGNYLCEATYGGFIGMLLDQRIQAALMGLGRLYGLSTAIKLADIPGANAATIEKELFDYQKTLAVTAASAQSVAMQVANQAQPSQQDLGQQPMPPGAAPQRPGMAPAPMPSQVGFTMLGDVERTLGAIKPQLHGGVWAIGELAAVGMSSRPIVMVQSEKDIGVVRTLMQQLHVYVVPGHPGDELPNLQVA